jgi:hypothetical protein
MENENTNSAEYHKEIQLKEAIDAIEQNKFDAFLMDFELKRKAEKLGVSEIECCNILYKNHQELLLDIKKQLNTANGLEKKFYREYHRDVLKRILWYYKQLQNLAEDQKSKRDKYEYQKSVEKQAKDLENVKLQLENVTDIAQILKDSETENDTKFKQQDKVTLLIKLGLVDELKKRSNDPNNTSPIADIVSFITGEPKRSIYPKIRSYLQNDSTNNPLHSERAIARYKTRMTNKGFDFN